MAPTDEYICPIFYPILDRNILNDLWMDYALNCIKISKRIIF